MSIIKTYTTELENGIINIDVKVETETVWLTQKHLAKLFNCDISNISNHIKNIYNDGELEETSTCEEIKNAEQINNLGLPKQGIKHYNLDMIISLGFRVNSKEAVKFRKWANAVIKELLTTGRVDLNSKLDSYMIEDKRERALRWIEELDERKALVAEVVHKTEVLTALTDGLDFKQIRQVLNKVVRRNTNNFQTKWRQLYSHFEMIHHCNLSLMSERKKCSKLDYIEKHLNKLPELYKVAVKLFETDVTVIRKELFGN